MMKEKHVSYLLNTHHAGALPSDDPHVTTAQLGDEARDIVRMYVKVTDGVLKEARYQCLAGPYFIICLEWLCSYAEGRALDDLLALRVEEVMQKIDYPAVYHHAVWVCLICLQKALKEE